MTAIIALDRNNWSDLTFWTAPSGNNQLVERLRITTEGNVGIGTTNPSAKLQVAGTLAAASVNATTSLSVNGTDISTIYAPINNPTFSGTAAATTPATSDNSTKIATTAYVQSNLSNYLTTAAATAYQTISGMSSYLTTAIAASTYASKTATVDQSFAGNIVIGTGKALSTPAITLNGTDLTATLQTFLTTTSATSLYQTISGMSSYLTTAIADRKSVV